MSSSARTQRILSELKQLELEPPPGICAWPVGDSVTEFEAGEKTKMYHFILLIPRIRNENKQNNKNKAIQGNANTPYSGGLFKLLLNIPERY